MNILVSTNDNYVMPLSVLLTSLFDTNERPMTVYLLWADLSEESRELLKRLVEGRGHALVEVPVGGEEFAGLPTKEYISRETYYRLLAAEVLPAELNRILWLDADMVVNGPIGEFYDSDFEGAAVVACPHGPMMRETILEDCAMVGIERPEQYFNAGVMLCNLAAWREMDIPGAIRELASVPRKLMFPGQDFTNLVFNGRVKTADWRAYNCMIHSVLPDEVPALKETARIIHYVGQAKPWKFEDIPFADVWMSFYEKSPFGSRPLRRTSYAKMRRMYELMQARKAKQ